MASITDAFLPIISAAKKPSTTIFLERILDHSHSDSRSIRVSLVSEMIMSDFRSRRGRRFVHRLVKPRTRRLAQLLATSRTCHLLCGHLSQAGSGVAAAAVHADSQGASLDLDASGSHLLRSTRGNDRRSQGRIGGDEEQDGFVVVDHDELVDDEQDEDHSSAGRHGGRGRHRLSHEIDPVGDANDHVGRASSEDVRVVSASSRRGRRNAGSRRSQLQKENRLRRQSGEEYEVEILDHHDHERTTPSPSRQQKKADNIIENNDPWTTRGPLDDEEEHAPEHVEEEHDFHHHRLHEHDHGQHLEDEAITRAIITSSASRRGDDDSAGDPDEEGEALLRIQHEEGQVVRREHTRPKRLMQRSRKSGDDDEDVVVVKASRSSGSRYSTASSPSSGRGREATSSRRHRRSRGEQSKKFIDVDPQGDVSDEFLDEHQEPSARARLGRRRRSPSTKPAHDLQGRIQAQALFSTSKVAVLEDDSGDEDGSPTEVETTDQDILSDHALQQLKEGETAASLCVESTGQVIPDEYVTTKEVNQFDKKVAEHDCHHFCFYEAECEAFWLLYPHGLTGKEDERTGISCTLYNTASWKEKQGSVGPSVKRSTTGLYLNPDGTQANQATVQVPLELDSLVDDNKWAMCIQSEEALYEFSCPNGTPDASAKAKMRERVRCESCHTGFQKTALEKDHYDGAADRYECVELSSGEVATAGTKATKIAFLVVCLIVFTVAGGIFTMHIMRQKSAKALEASLVSSMLDSQEQQPAADGGAADVTGTVTGGEGVPLVVGEDGGAPVAIGGGDVANGGVVVVAGTADGAVQNVDPVPVDSGAAVLDQGAGEENAAEQSNSGYQIPEPFINNRATD
ncbi:unnamed protein product [Amoebophrya sp. A25]|nr:unnamed protein product [Amoebophrya sp. A25]|eukprot:GSA25T00012479001.1